MRTQIDLRLARHGAILLLLGMLTGFVTGKFQNHTAANAAHLVGLIGGYGLIAIALLWPRLSLRGLWSSAGAWITAASLYLNWLGVILIAGWRNGPKPVDSAASGTPAVWAHVGGIVLQVAALLSLVSVLMILIGLRKLAASREGDANEGLRDGRAQFPSM